MPVKGPGGNRSGLGGVSYGELYGVGVNLAVTAATPATIIGLTNGDTFSTTLTGASGTITTDIAEPVAVDISVSFSTTAVNSVVIGSLVKGVTPQTDIAFQRTISSASTIGVITMSGIINLAAGDILSITVTSDKNATLTFEELNFRVTGLGAVLAPVLSLIDYLKLSGRGGGQVANGGTAASEALELHSTAHATKGLINLADTLYVNEVNDRVGIGVSAPSEMLQVKDGDVLVNNTLGALNVYFDGYNSGNDGSNFQLRKQDDPGNNRTVLSRLFSTHSSVPDQFRFDHRVGGAQVVLLAFDNNGDVLFNPVGDTGFGTSAPSEKLHVVGDIRATATYTSTTASAANMFVDSTGKYFRSTSSARYKRNIRALGFDALKVLDLELRTFESPVDGDKTYFGVVAEQAHEVLPEIVVYRDIYDQEPEAILDEEGNTTGEFNLGNKIGEEPDAIMYDRIAILLIPIVTELKDRVKTLENQNQTQQNLINDLVKRVEALEGN